MAHALTPTATAPGSTTVTVPDGGDPRTAASVTTPIQALYNLLLWVVGVLTGAVNQAVHFFSSLTVDGNLILSGTAIMSSFVTHSDAVTFDNSGRVVPRVHVQAATAGMTASVAIASEYHYTSAAASSAVQIDATGAQLGETFEFTNFDTANAVTIKNPAGATLTTIRNNTGLNYSVTVKLIGTSLPGTWTVTRLWVGA